MLKKIDFFFRICFRIKSLKKIKIKKKIEKFFRHGKFYVLSVNLMSRQWRLASRGREGAALINIEIKIYVE